MLRLLSAIMVDDELEDSILTEKDETDDKKSKNIATDTENDEHESETDESVHERTDDGNNTIMPTSKVNLLSGTSSRGDKKVPEKKKEITRKRGLPKKTPTNEEPILCKFFNNGRCSKTKEECRFDHPRICQKFNQFGPKNGINKC